MEEEKDDPTTSNIQKQKNEDACAAEGSAGTRPSITWAGAMHHCAVLLSLQPSPVRRIPCPPLRAGKMVCQRQNNNAAILSKHHHVHCPGKTSS